MQKSDPRPFAFGCQSPMGAMWRSSNPERISSSSSCRPLVNMVEYVFGGDMSSWYDLWLSVTFDSPYGRNLMRFEGVFATVKSRLWCESRQTFWKRENTWETRGKLLPTFCKFISNSKDPRSFSSSHSFARQHTEVIYEANFSQPQLTWVPTG